MRITSTANPIIRHVRSLDSVGARRDEGLFLVEGVRLVSEALRWSSRPSIVLYDPEELSRTDPGTTLAQSLPSWGDRVYAVDARVLKAAAQTEHPGGVLVVLPIPENPALRVNFHGVGVVLDKVTDPGNVGAILRAADAFNAAFVIAITGSADFYAPKVVRAAMGAHFRLPLLPRSRWADVREILADVPFIATAAREGDSVEGFEWPDRSVLVIGGEANGLSAEARESSNQYLHIPMRAEVESLNAAMAASIMLFAAHSSNTPAKL